MTSTVLSSAELCRMTVIGPNGRADLAVPVSSTVASLLPVLLRHTADRADWDGAWVLQRIGEAPLDPDGTPETLGLLEGEQLHLRPADDPLLELDFDDVADGIAKVVGDQPNRWRPEYGRPLFLGLASGVAGLVALLLLGQAREGRWLAAAGIGALCLAVTPVAARALGDRAVATLTGLLACLFAALAGLGAGVPLSSHAPGARPADLLTWQPSSLLLAATGAALVTEVLLAMSTFAGVRVPFAVFGTVLVVAAAGCAALATRLGLGLSAAQAAGVTATALYVLVVVGPKVAIRMARLRGPQLPRTAEELQWEIEPEPADRLTAQARLADGWLNVLAIASALVMPVAFAVLLRQPGWVGPALVAAFGGAVLLRGRGALGAWQRVSLVVAGGVGLAMVLLAFGWPASSGRLGAVILGLFAVAGLLVQAAVRPPRRRPRPIWGHLANILDALAAFTLIPLLLQLFGVYLFARGLAG